MAEVPPRIVEQLQTICLALPETHEEAAWVGMRWRVRKQTFAHVLMVEAGWPPAYAKAAKADGCVLTFRSLIAGLDPGHYAQAPFFRPRWRPDIVGLMIGGDTDWEAIAQLLKGSYRALAPKTLASHISVS